MLNKLFFVLAVLGTSMDEEGWTSVKKTKQSTSEVLRSESFEESWPVFIRQFGQDRALIRFPNEPSYSYPYAEEGDLETVYIEAQEGENVYRLIVDIPSSGFDFFMEQKKIAIGSLEDALLVSVEQVNEQSFDVLYRYGKKWIRERVIASSERFYTLQTVADAFQEKNHFQFINSFDLEIRDENKVFHREIQSEN